MSLVVLDTTVASMLHLGRPEAALYHNDIAGKSLSLSFHTVAELLHWAEASSWGARRRSGLVAFMRRHLIVPYEFGLAETWARMMTAAERQGRRLQDGDAWIAATAAYRRAPLLTHDGDFRAIRFPGLRVVCHAP